MYKNIVPDLITFDTELKHLRGFNLSNNFNFYTETEKRSKFHYKILIDDDFKTPEDYDFRSGYYFKSGNDWFYQRYLFGGFYLKFKYNSGNKIFSFNRLYSFLPIELGGIIPVGRHISNIINLELFLNDFVVFFGSAINFNNKNLCVIAPSFNGKTTFVESVLKIGGMYIAEDILILDISGNKVFPTACRKNNYGRNTNRRLVRKIVKTNVVEKACYVNKLIFVQNSTTKEGSSGRKNIISYLFLNGLRFMDNPFIKAYMFENNLTNEVLNKIRSIDNLKITCQITNIKDFNYNELLK